MLIKRFFLLCLGLWLAPHAWSDAQELQLVDGQKRFSLAIETVRQTATVERTMFGPFRRADVDFRGHDLYHFLQQTFGRPVTSVKLTAFDGYQVTLAGLKNDGHWLLVTHENNQPLALRNHGPVRLIETDLGQRSKKNLSLYDDWIWMLVTIEALD